MKCSLDLSWRSKFDVKKYRFPLPCFQKQKFSVSRYNIDMADKLEGIEELLTHIDHVGVDLEQSVHM